MAWMLGAGDSGTADQRYCGEAGNGSIPLAGRSQALGAHPMEREQVFVGGASMPKPLLGRSK